MGMHNQRVGRRGERLAAEWYRAAGYRVVDRNWRCSIGEIDLVASGHGVVVFCEVKTRSSMRYGHPAEAVTADKQLRVRRLASEWMGVRAHGRRVRRRFDVAAVVGSTVSIIEGAF